MPPKTLTYETYMGWQREQYMSKCRWLSGKESACQCRGHGFDAWCKKLPHAKKQLNPCTMAVKPVLWSPGISTTEPMRYND